MKFIVFDVQSFQANEGFGLTGSGLLEINLEAAALASFHRSEASLYHVTGHIFCSFLRSIIFYWRM